MNYVMWKSLPLSYKKIIIGSHIYAKTVLFSSNQRKHVNPWLDKCDVPVLKTPVLQVQPVLQPAGAWGRLYLPHPHPATATFTLARDPNPPTATITLARDTQSTPSPSNGQQVNFRQWGASLQKSAWGPYTGPGPVPSPAGSGSGSVQHAGTSGDCPGSVPVTALALYQWLP